jgi:RimJ/RimL family protein N-acetyltransferase
MTKTTTETTKATLPTLTTTRLTLRPWRTEDEVDVAAFHAIQGDPRVIWWGHAADVAASRAVMHNRAAKDEPPVLGTWAIELHNVVVGNALLIRSELGVEIGWHVRRDHQGRGIATEAAAALVDHAGGHGVDVVVAAIVPVNVPSQRVAQKLGLVVAGSCTKAGLFHECWRGRP